MYITLHVLHSQLREGAKQKARGMPLTTTIIVDARYKLDRCAVSLVCTHMFVPADWHLPGVVSQWLVWYALNAGTTLVLAPSSFWTISHSRLPFSGNLFIPTFHSSGSRLIPLPYKGIPPTLLVPQT